MSKRNELIIWFETPPKVSKGAFNYVTEKWGNKVLYVINRDFGAERKLTNWNDGNFGKAELIYLSEMDNSDQAIEDIFKTYPNAIHILGGFTNAMQFRVRKYVLKDGVKLGLFSERPDTMGGWFEKTARKMYFQYKYRKLRALFEPYLSVVFPLGRLGVETFASFGWSKEIMYPFMYNPVINIPKERAIVKKNNTVRFLYVGRFYYKTKGIDTLMKATKYLKGDWSLDLVGGYGKNADEVIEWVNSQENVNYLGAWQSQDVCRNMTQYDVVVVPSKYDGWNLLPNEALHAGIATIATDEAVSDEMISTSGAGVVVPSNNPQKMAKAMQKAIDCPEELKQWKKNCESYIERISSERVGEYFMEILDYTFYNKSSSEKPKCPWL